MMGENQFRIIQVGIPSDALSNFERLPNLDWIGDAWFAPIESLQGIDMSIWEIIP